MADVQIAVIDQQNTEVTIAVPGVQGPVGATGDVAIAQDGTAALPGIRFENDTNTGIYSPGADQVAISTNGTGRLFVDANGNVGIGTTSPSELLHVNGNAIVEDRLLLQRLQSSDNLSVLTFSDTLTGSKGNNLSIGNPGGYDVLFHTGGVEKARIDSSGRLLVGTSSTSGNITNQDKLAVVITGNDTQGGLSVTNYAGTSATIGSNACLRLQRSNGVTDGSFTALSASAWGLGRIEFNGSNGSGFGTGATIEGMADTAAWSSGDHPARLVFSSTPSGSATPVERMRISSDGALRCFSANTVVRAFSATGAGGVEYLYGGYYSATDNLGTGSTLSFAVFTNGDTVNTNNSYGAISDIKLKENIVDANSQWDDLKALQVRNYNFKEGQTHTQIGLVAQEAELVSPGLVSESPDRDEEGNDLGTVTKSVNYSVLYMKAVKALQEAMERIEVLEAKVNALEGN